MENVKDELEKYSKKLDEETNELSKKLINEITEVLERDEKIRGRIPEEFFVDNFLEYFKNIKDSKPEQDPLMQQWLNISGSVYNEVELLDREGNITAVVPPLISKKSMEIDKLENVEFTEMGKHYEIISDNDGIRAYNYVTTELSQLPKCINTQTTGDAASRWLRIFERYSRKNVNENNDEIKKINKKLKEDFGIDYDAD